jgi:RNA polymerase sigma factor (sigma-70 family)
MRFLRSKKVVPVDDASVVETYRRTSDTACIGILFDRYCHLVFAVSMNYLKNEEDSKDVVIHIFEKLPDNLKKYEVNNFSHWLYTITKNHCLKQLNKRQFNAPINEDLNYFVSDDPATEDAAIQDQFLSNLGDAIASLNDEQKKCIQLFYLEEKSYKEIEDITGYNYEKVKSYIQNGKRNLRIYLLKKNGKQ